MIVHFWFFAALIASIMWGLGYVLSEILLKVEGITPLLLATLTSLITLPIFISLGLYFGAFEKGLEAFQTNPKLIPILILEAFTIIGGTFLVYMSVAEKNAALTSIIESTYPIFAVFFGLFLLKEFQINSWTIFGMLITITGVSIVLLKSH